MGALGLLYGDIITKTLGRDSVHFIADGERVQRLRGRNFSVNGEAKDFNIVAGDAAKPYDLVIVAVKWGQLTAALDTMKNCVGDKTIILSVLNGISSEQIIAARYGEERVLGTVAQGMDAMHSDGALRYTQMGELHIGTLIPSQKPLLDTLTEFFGRCNMPYVTEANMKRRLWSKFMLNVGINQVCAAYRVGYAAALAPGEPREMLLGAMHETLALANAEGIALSEADIDDWLAILGTLAPDGLPSMAQDIAARRKTEVQMFACVVIEKSARHGLKTPVNEALYAKITALEEEF